MSSQGDRPRHDRAAGQHGSGLRAADKRVNMAGAHCVCDGEVYGTNEVLRRRVKDSVILYSFGVCRYAWAFSKRMSRGTGCVNCARPGLWGSPSGNRGALPGKDAKRLSPGQSHRGCTSDASGGRQPFRLFRPFRGRKKKSVPRRHAPLIESL